MITAIMGSTGSGKTIVLKQRLLLDLQNNQPIIYLNFRDSSNEFSAQIKNDALIVNANSFTQLSKVKNKEYNDIIFINKTFSHTNISVKIKKNLILEILKNENWKNHNIYIDEGFELDKDLQKIISISKRNVIITFHCERDLKDLSVDKYLLLKNRYFDSFTEKLSKYKTDFENKEKDTILYLELYKGKEILKGIKIPIFNDNVNFMNPSFISLLEKQIIDSDYKHHKTSFDKLNNLLKKIIRGRNDLSYKLLFLS